MIKTEFTNCDLGFDEYEGCILRFSFRSNGVPRCRLVLDSDVSEMLRTYGCKAVSAKVDQYGNILVGTVNGDRTLSSDSRACISLDRYANDLLEMYDNNDVCYSRVVMAGQKMIVLAPKMWQP